MQTKNMRLVHQNKKDRWSQEFPGVEGEAELSAIRPEAAPTLALDTVSAFHKAYSKALAQLIQTP